MNRFVYILSLCLVFGIAGSSVHAQFDGEQLFLSPRWQSGDSMEWHYLRGLCYNNLECESTFVGMTVVNQPLIYLIADNYSELLGYMEDYVKFDTRPANDDAEPIGSWTEVTRFSRMFAFLTFTNISSELKIPTYRYWIQLFLSSSDLDLNDTTITIQDVFTKQKYTEIHAEIGVDGDPSYLLTLAVNEEFGFIDHFRLSEFLGDWFWESTIIKMDINALESASTGGSETSNLLLVPAGELITSIISLSFLLSMRIRRRKSTLLKN